MIQVATELYWQSFTLNRNSHLPWSEQVGRKPFLYIIYYIYVYIWCFSSFMILSSNSTHSSEVQRFLDGGQTQGDVCDFAVDEFACASVSGRNLSLKTCCCPIKIVLRNIFPMTGWLSCRHTAVGCGGEHIGWFPGVQSLHQHQQHAAGLEASAVQSFQCAGWCFGPSVKQGEDHSSSLSSCFLRNLDTGF